MVRVNLRLKALVAAIALAVAVPAFAQQTAQPTIPGFYSSQQCPPSVNNCYTPQLKALAGTQRGVSIASATALTIPTGASFVLISVQGTNNSGGICAYWQDDGTDPTTSAGQPLAALSVMRYFVKSLPIKLIQASGATCTFNASYYG